MTQTPPRFSESDDAWHIYENPELTPQEKFNIFDNCRCCSVHRSNRPTEFEPWFDEMSVEEFRRTPRQKEAEDACPCKCRRFIRFICRKCETPYSSDSESSSAESPLSDID